MANGFGVTPNASLDSILAAEQEGRLADAVSVAVRAGVLDVERKMSRLQAMPAGPARDQARAELAASADAAFALAVLAPVLDKNMPGRALAAAQAASAARAELLGERVTGTVEARLEELKRAFRHKELTSEAVSAGAEVKAPLVSLQPATARGAAQLAPGVPSPVELAGRRLSSRGRESAKLPYAYRLIGEVPGPRGGRLRVLSAKDDAGSRSGGAAERNADAFRGDPTSPIDFLGPEAAAFLGIRRVGRSAVTTPDHNELNAALNEYNESASSEDRVRMGFYRPRSKSVSDRDYAWRFATRLEHPLSDVDRPLLSRLSYALFGPRVPYGTGPAADADEALHDINVHLLGIFLPTEALEHRAAQVAAVREFDAFVRRRHWLLRLWHAFWSRKGEKLEVESVAAVADIISRAAQRVDLVTGFVGPNIAPFNSPGNMREVIADHMALGSTPLEYLRRELGAVSPYVEADLRAFAAAQARGSDGLSWLDRRTTLTAEQVERETWARAARMTARMAELQRRAPEPENTSDWAIADTWLGYGPTLLTVAGAPAKYIGSGDFGTVYRHPTRAGAVVKVARHGWIRWGLWDANAGLAAEDRRLARLARVGVAPRPLARAWVNGRAATVREFVEGRALNALRAEGAFSSEHAAQVEALVEDLAVAGLLPTDLHGDNILFGRRAGAGPSRAWIIDSVEVRDISHLPLERRRRAVADELAAGLRGPLLGPLLAFRPLARLLEGYVATPRGAAVPET